MKKILIILVAIIGFGISANAQCDLSGATVKNVSASWGNTSLKSIVLYNGNDGQISVQVEVTFVNKDGSKKTVKELFALRANSSMTPAGKTASVNSGWTGVDCEKTTVKITIIGG